MFCYGLTSYMPMLGGFGNPLGFFSPMMPAVPKYSVNDYNIFGFTPPVNFGYMPWLDNGIKPYNVYPQPLLFGTGNYTPPERDYSAGGLFNFLYNPINSEGGGNIFGFLLGTSKLGTSKLGTKESKSTAGNVTKPSYHSWSYGGYNSDTFGFLTAKSKTKVKPETSYSSHASSGSNSTVNKAVQLALSQIGEKEASKNDSQTIRKYKNGSVDNNAWCGSFASWCYGAGQGTNNGKTFGYDMSSQSMKSKAEKAGFYSTKSSGYKPKVGDLMILQYDNKPGGHVGIVVAVNSDGSFDTVEGNCGNAVKKVHRSMSSANLHGFVRMNDWLQA